MLARMSGIEVLGLAASILQIADLGARLSVQLYTFSIKVKNANVTVATVHRDVALTSSVLGELGQTLRDTSSRGSWSPTHNAITTAKELLEESEKIYAELSRYLGGGDQHLPPKSKLLLMVHVMTFAKLQRSCSMLPSFCWRS